MGQFVCDGTCAGNELGDCNHGASNDGLPRGKSEKARTHKERDRIVARLRARAATEQLTADRATSGRLPFKAAGHQKAADVLLDEVQRLEDGV